MTTKEKQECSQENSGTLRLRMNEDANLYHESNSIQTRDANICLKEYVPKMKWDEGENRIIDIGSGDGSVTNIIKNFIPKNYKEIIGCDISEKMVKFANNNYKNEKSHFRVLDIEGSLPDELKEGFNHVFSFYTLHWIKNQEKAFTNIYNMLLKDGDCLLAFLGRMPVYTAFWAVAGTIKWKKWMPNYELFMSPYHHFTEPEKYITNMLKKIGFNNIELNCKQMNFTYSIKDFKNFVRSINPCAMPKEVFDNFLDDYIVLMRDMRLMDHLSDDNEISDSTTITLPYNLIVVFATKP